MYYTLIPIITNNNNKSIPQDKIVLCLIFSVYSYLSIQNQIQVRDIVKVIDGPFEVSFFYLFHVLIFVLFLSFFFHFFFLFWLSSLISISSKLPSIYIFLIPLYFQEYMYCFIFNNAFCVSFNFLLQTYYIFFFSFCFTSRGNKVKSNTCFAVTFSSNPKPCWRMVEFLLLKVVPLSKRELER